MGKGKCCRNSELLPGLFVDNNALVYDLFVCKLSRRSIRDARHKAVKIWYRSSNQTLHAVKHGAAECTYLIFHFVRDF